MKATLIASAMLAMSFVPNMANLGRLAHSTSTSPKAAMQCSKHSAKCTVKVSDCKMSCEKCPVGDCCPLCPICPDCSGGACCLVGK